MKILWIVNTIFPELAEVLGREKTIYGGWMYGLASFVSNQENMELVIATVYNGDFCELDINRKSYVLIPNVNEKELRNFWKIVAQKYKPDVVHIHGTEFEHGLIYMKENGNSNVVFSIQGLLNVYSKYYLGDISFREILANLSLRDVLKCDNLFQQKSKIKNRGVVEKKYFDLAKHVIGRTDWDFSHSYFLNKAATYHFCNEMLRERFYKSKKWQIDNCVQFSIFLSQASYPIKGMHKVLEAVALLKDEFPNISVRIGGTDIIKTKTIKDKVKITGYGKIIKNRIKKLGLSDNIEFLGNLQEDEMVQEYLRSHIFICPSSIENSPNSLGEAQFLGVPTISSYVGGAPNMISHGENGFLYRFEEVEVLANLIKKIYTDDLLSLKLSSNGIMTAENRHNKDVIVDTLLGIYNIIIKEIKE